MIGGRAVRREDAHGVLEVQQVWSSAGVQPHPVSFWCRARAGKPPRQEQEAVPGQLWAARAW